MPGLCPCYKCVLQLAAVIETTVTIHASTCRTSTTGTEDSDDIWEDMISAETKSKRKRHMPERSVHGKFPSKHLRPAVYPVVFGLVHAFICRNTLQSRCS